MFRRTGKITPVEVEVKEAPIDSAAARIALARDAIYDYSAVANPSFPSDHDMKNIPRDRLVGALAAAALAALVALFYFFSQDRDFAADLFKALFGLSGGSTAGG